MVAKWIITLLTYLEKCVFRIDLKLLTSDISIWLSYLHRYEIVVKGCVNTVWKLREFTLMHFWQKCVKATSIKKLISRNIFLLRKQFCFSIIWWKIILHSVSWISNFRITQKSYANVYSKLVYAPCKKKLYAKCTRGWLGSE